MVGLHSLTPENVDFGNIEAAQSGLSIIRRMYQDGAKKWPEKRRVEGTPVCDWGVITEDFYNSSFRDHPFSRQAQPTRSFFRL